MYIPSIAAYNDGECESKNVRRAGRYEKRGEGREKERKKEKRQREKKERQKQRNGGGELVRVAEAYLLGGVPHILSLLDGIPVHKIVWGYFLWLLGIQSRGG